MSVRYIFIINKYGALAYYRFFGEKSQELTSNQSLVFASSLHGIFMITAQMSPIPGSSGLRVVRSKDSNIFCYESLTGLKIILITDKDVKNASSILSRICVLFSNYVSTNPFYQPEMPVRIDIFDKYVTDEIENI